MDRAKTAHTVTRPVALGPQKADRLHHHRLSRIRDGDPLRQQIRSACVRCNTGWMSQVQERAATVVGPFVRGDFPELTDGSREALATWVTMVVMNIEYADPETVMIPGSQREALMKSSRPLPNWYVGIARYDGAQMRSTFHHRAFGWRAASGSPADDEKAQSTVFGLGKALFHALSTDSSFRFEQLVGGRPLQYGEVLGLRSIWPESRFSLAAAGQPLGDTSVGEIIDHFGRMPTIGNPIPKGA